MQQNLLISIKFAGYHRTKGKIKQDAETSIISPGLQTLILSPVFEGKHLLYLELAILRQ